MRIETLDAIAAVEVGDWNACAGEGNPFVTHEFLKALEDSGSVGEGTGWTPLHLIARDGESIVAAAPLYAKDHSQGEYVFDHGWAEAFMRAGGRYYPKLQLAVPFTPVPGPRLLVHPQAPGDTRATLVAALAEITKRAKVSSLHATFLTDTDRDAFAAGGFLIREGFQFHWNNRGYASFDDFLADLSHSRRKAIKRERRAVADQGIALEILTGDALKPGHWDHFFSFYMATSDRKWGDPYLTRDFFDRLHQTMRARVALVMARHDGRWIGGALNLIGHDALYGRNWGCLGDWPFLHFEACYYQAIEFAIAAKLPRVEAGAQGEHKLQRGYLPVPTWSAHWIAHEGFRRAVADFLIRERAAVRARMAEYGAEGPFKG